MTTIHINKREVTGSNPVEALICFSQDSSFETVSSTYILMGRYNHSLSLNATIVVSKNCTTIDDHVVTIFVTQ